MTNWGFLNRDLPLLQGKSLCSKNEQGLVPKIVKRGANRKKNRPVQVRIPATLSTRKFYRQTNHVTKSIDHAQVGKTSSKEQ